MGDGLRRAIRPDPRLAGRMPAMIGRILLAVVLAALLIWRLILAEIEEQKEAAGR
jgi:hypothetical protein